MLGLKLLILTITILFLFVSSTKTKPAFFCLNEGGCKEVRLSSRSFEFRPKLASLKVAWLAVGTCPTEKVTTYGEKEIYFRLAIKDDSADQRDCHLSVTSRYKNLHHRHADRLKHFFSLLFLFTMLCLDLVHQLLYKNVWYAYICLTGFGRKLCFFLFLPWRRLTKRQCVSRLWIAVNYSACAYLRLNRKKMRADRSWDGGKREPRRWYLGAADPEAADPLPSSGRQIKSSLEKAWESRNQTVRGEREITGFNSTPCSHQFSLNSQPILHAYTDLRL